MASRRKTRLGKFTHMINLIGTGRELLSSKLPTLRDCLKYGILLREQNYPADSLAKDIHPELLEKWGRANRCFVVTIVNSWVTILKKIQDSWEQAQNISLGKRKINTKEAFTSKLDKLFDILNYKCTIVFCSECSCFADDTCKHETHINCTCLRDMKIPVKELAFIKGQREKCGFVGPHQIGLLRCLSTTD